MTIVFEGCPRDGGATTDPEELKLSGRALRLLPDSATRNPTLKILDASDNLLGEDEESLVRQLSGLRGLRRLNVSGNRIKVLPVDAISCLEVLCAAGNEIEHLSEGVTGLHRLERLHLDFNLLSCLPPDWSSLASLTTLTLSNNRLQEVPATLWTLPRLERLDLRSNRIAHLAPLPDSTPRELSLARNRLSGNLDLSTLQNLTVLDVSHNELEDLDVSKLDKLETVIVSHNSLKHLILDGTNLRSLHADANELEKISCKQAPLYLESLSFSHNHLTFVPEWLSETKSLSTLSADHNQIAFVPKDLFANCNLRSVHLNHNSLEGLPELLTPCHVRTLCLQYNKIEQLPENFFLALPCLETLNLSFNLLQCVPPSYGTNTALKHLFVSGNRLTDLSNLSNLLGGSRIETLHLAANGIRDFPQDFFSSLLCLRTLSLSSNGLERLPAHLSKVESLQKLYLHSNRMGEVPTLRDAPHLQVLDLACNHLEHLELASIVPKDLTYLDLSANSHLQIDPTDFQHLCCQRSVAVVDVNCAGRPAPVSESVAKESEANTSPWRLGFTESHEGNTRLYVEFQKDEATGRQEALIALLEVDDGAEVAELRRTLPDLLRAERENRETPYLKNALLATLRFVREVRAYHSELGITMCHLSSSSSGVTLRLGSVGRPPSCVLGRAGNVIVLAQRQEATPFAMQEWTEAMQATEVCCHNYLGSSRDEKASPKGLWSSVPDPEVRELVLSPQDKFLVFGDSAFSRTVPADEVCRQVQRAANPVAAGKALSEMYSALTNGRRECIAVIRFDAPHEEEVEKYRCWEFMLEQNHKLLFTKELETIHKTVGEQRPANGELASWYATAFSKYKCPLPSHRGRYYCYGSKAQ